jgi:hypothetical protein
MESMEKRMWGQRKLSLDKSWRQYMGSGKAIKSAIIKHGKENFTKELLTYAYTTEDLDSLEISLMSLERSKGKAEYNLHIGSAPFPNGIAYSNMTEQQRQESILQRSKSLKSHNDAKFTIFASEHGAKILETYARLQNCSQTAKKLNLSVKYTNRFLKDSGIDLKSNGKKRSIEVRQRISDSLKIRSAKVQSDRKKFDLTCHGCGEDFCSIRSKQKFCSRICTSQARAKKQFLPSASELHRLYWEENMSANQIGQMYSVSGQSIRNLMKENSVPRRIERSSTRSY